MYGNENKGDIQEDPLEILSRFPPEMLMAGLQLLARLEATNWQWDINTLLSQPEIWLDLVFSLKSIGENYRDQLRKSINSAPQ